MTTANLLAVLQTPSIDETEKEDPARVNSQCKLEPDPGEFESGDCFVDSRSDAESHAINL